MPEFFAGIGGFVGFEAIRIYRRLWSGKPIAPLERWVLYSFVLTVIGVFSGWLSTLLSDGSLGEAIFVGFSVPSSLKTLLGRPIGDDIVDDIEVNSLGWVSGIWSSVREYLWF